jgi:hypothetical protein
MWWQDRRATFPQLSRMALDYLSAPGMLHQEKPPLLIMIILVN